MTVRRSTLISGCEKWKHIYNPRSFFFLFCFFHNYFERRGSRACKYAACPISNHAVMSKRIHNTEQRRRVCFLPASQPSSPLAASAELIEAVWSNRLVKKDLLPRIGNEQIRWEIRCCYLWPPPNKARLSALQSGSRAGAERGSCFWQTPLLLLFSNSHWNGSCPQERLQLLNISDLGCILHHLIAVVGHRSRGFQSDVFLNWPRCMRAISSSRGREEICGNQSET